MDCLKFGNWCKCFFIIKTFLLNIALSHDSILMFSNFIINIMLQLIYPFDANNISVIQRRDKIPRVIILDLFNLITHVIISIFICSSFFKVGILNKRRGIFTTILRIQINELPIESKYLFWATDSNLDHTDGWRRYPN